MRGGKKAPDLGPGRPCSNPDGRHRRGQEPESGWLYSITSAPLLAGGKPDKKRARHTSGDVCDVCLHTLPGIGERFGPHNGLIIIDREVVRIRYRK